MFYSILFLGFIGSLTRNPVYAFALYEAVYFFNPEQRWWGSMVPDFSYSFFVVLLMIFLLIVNFKRVKENSLLKIPQFRWMYVILTLYGIAYFYSALPDEHYEALVYFLKLIVIVSIAYKLCDSAAKLNYVLYGYIFGAWYIGFVAYQLGRNSGDRVEGIGTVDSPDSNGIAAAIAPTLVMALYYFLTSKNWILKSLFVIAGVFIANGLVLINSRGAFLAVGASILFFMLHMYFSPFQRKYQKATAIFITVAGLAGAGSLMDDSFIERMKSIENIEVNEEQESGATRIEFWKAAFNMAKDHPFGAGNRGFDYYAPQYIPENIDTGRGRNRSVHSTWFEALSEIGYFGLLALFIMLYTAFRSLNYCKKTLKNKNQADEYFKMVAIQAALLAFIVAMTFMNRLRADVLYWLILYSACAYNVYVLKVSVGVDAKR